MQITGIHTVGIPVRDQARALDFYTGVLGLEVRVDAQLGGDRRWIEVAPAPGGPSIALVAAHDGVPAGVETGIRLVAADAQAARDQLLASGASAGDLLRWPGVPVMFQFHDLDGNALEIIEQP